MSRKSDKRRIADIPEFDITQHLASDRDIAEYLSVVLESDDPSLLAAALGDIARARGMTEIAKAAGLSREALYKALRPAAAPRFETVRRVCSALGLRLTVATQRGKARSLAAKSHRAAG